MKSICFIAAREGSKGVSNKNLRKIAGKPLIAYTIEAAKQSNLFEHIIVSTESEKISKIAKKFGAEVPFKRPKKLASDTTGMPEVMIHGIQKLFSMGYEFDVIVLRDCTVPFIQNIDIKNALKLLSQKKPDAVFGVYKQHLNPYFNMVELDSNGSLKLCKKPKKEILSRQQAPIVFQVTGLFVFNVKSFLRYKNFFMQKVLPYEIPIESGLMIDTEFEFKMAELIFKEKLLHKI